MYCFWENNKKYRDFMKNLLTSLVLFFVVFITKAQEEYTIDITGGIYGGNECGSIHGLREIDLIFEDGTFDRIHGTVGGFTNSTFSYLEKFNVSNKVVSIRTYSIAQKDKYGGADCESDKATRTVNVSTPCFYNRFDRDEVYENSFSTRSYMEVSIYPNISLDFADNTPKEETYIVCKNESVGLKSNFSNLPTSVYNWEFYDILHTNTYTHPDYQVLLDTLAKAKDDHGECENGCEDTGDEPSPTDPACVRACEEKEQKNIDEAKAAIAAYLSAGRPLTLTLLEPEWKTIPVDKSGQTAVNIKLSDIYPNVGDQSKVLGKTLDIRLNTSCIDEIDKTVRPYNITYSVSNQLAIQFLPEPPNIIDVDFPERTCAGERVSNLILDFDRDLLPDEQLNVNIVKRQGVTYIGYFNNAPGEDEEDVTISLTRINDSTYRYELLIDSDLTDGDYRVDTFSYFSGSGLASCGQSVDLENDDSVYKFNVDSPDPITFDIEVTAPTCTESNTGKATITSVNNGSGSYQYNLNGSSNWFNVISLPFTIRSLRAGNNTIKVRDRDNISCESQDDDNIVFINTVSSRTILNDVEILPPASPGAFGEFKTGAITGDLPFEDTDGRFYYLMDESIYDLDTGEADSESSEIKVYASGFSKSNMREGEYEYSFYGQSRCSVRQSFTFIDPDPLTLGYSFVGNFSCSDSEDVEIIAKASGGYEPYTFTWYKEGELLVEDELTEGETESSIFASPTTYSVFLEDARGIKLNVTNFSTPAAPNPVAFSTSVTAPSCFGDNGVIRLTGSGGQGGYLYAQVVGGVSIDDLPWQRGNTFNLPASNVGYRFIAKDRAGCESEISASVIIAQPKEIGISTTASGIVNNTVFNGTSGSISISIVEGTAPYTTSWTRNGSSISKAGTTITELSAGTYVATVTDANTCVQVSNTIVITEPEALTATISTGTSIKCFNGQGTLRVTAEGGIGSYTYQWYEDGILINGATSASLSSIGAGDYTVEVSEDYTSVVSSTYEFTQPTVLSLTGSKTDVSCFEGTDGSIELDPQGGTRPYSFSIDNKLTYIAESSLTDFTIDNLSKGDYEIWLKDANDCEFASSVSFTITEPVSMVIKETILPATVANGNNGSITIDVSEGVAPFTYSWIKEGDASFTEKTTKDIDNLTAGSYTVTVTDSNTCSIAATFEVQEPGPLRVSLEQTNNVLCHEDTTGELMATVEGGFPILSTINDFSFEWYLVSAVGDTLLESDFGLDSQIGLAAGRYKVVVTDQAGTVTEDIFVVSQPDDLQVSLSNAPTNVLCYGESTGVIEVTVTGGPRDEITGSYRPYTFEWTKTEDVDFSATTEDLVDITAGTYSLTVTDENSCVVTLLAPVIISEPDAALTISGSTTTNLTGFETDNGSIAVTVEGGTIDYTYEWRLAGDAAVIGNAPLIEDLAIGTYELTVIDGNGCEVEETYTVTEPALLVITDIDEQGNVLCHGDETVTLVATVDGGVGDYAYSWYAAADTVTKISITEALSDITGGTYNLIVTDANGNEANQTYIVSQPDELIASYTTTNVSCNAGNDGSIDISVEGGTGVYSYIWATGETTQDISGLVAGEYSVTVRDANLCETSLIISIEEPVAALNVSDTTIENTTGFELINGSIEVVIAGGTSDYSYEWKDSEDTVLPSTTNLLDGIGAGDYFLKVTDANGCELETDYTITEPAALSVRTDEVSIDCFGNTGQLIALVEGGVSPYSYQWYNASNELVSEESTANNIPTGTYSVTVIDASANQTELTDIILTHPDLLEITDIDIIDVTCYEGEDGSIRVTAIGGTGDYLYQWSHTTVSTNEVTSLTSGAYTVTITDENTCSVTSETINVLEPAPYEIIGVNLVRPSGITGAENGSIAIDITGGVAPYTYQWYDSDTNLVLEEVAVLAMSSSITTSEGVYSIRVTDAIGCEITDTYNLADPGELLVDIRQNQEVSCNRNNDGILEVLTVGGVGGNNFQWYSRSTGLDTAIAGETSAILRNLPVGSYYVVVSNAEGISEQSAVFQVTEPDAVVGTLTMDMPDCYQGNDGSITLTASGGNSDYSYRYRKDRGTYGDWISFNGNETEILTLDKGYYEIQLRDSNGCFYETLIRDIEVLSADIIEPDELVISNTLLIEPTGFNLSNGTITITAQGGTFPYTYEWSNGTGQLSATTNELSNIGTGIYSVTVTDSQQCRVSLELTLDQPDELLVAIEEVNVVSCFESSNGSLRANPSGGIGAYTYEWFKVGNVTTVGDEALLINVDEGTYYVIVTDVNGNEKQSENILVVQPELLEVSLTADYVLCGDGNDWTIESVVQGGTAPYTYFWSTGTTAASVENADIGTYIIYVADARGCTTRATIELELPEAMEVADNISNTTCFEGGDASISLLVSGGVAPYSYSWDNGATKANITDLSAGNYQVSITDAKGCVVVHSYDVIDPAQIVIDLGEDITLCSGQAAELDATINDPNAIYSWTSANGFISDEPTIVVATTGVYQVNVVTGKGCTASANIFVEAITDEIAAHFLTSTQVFVGEEFVVVDNSVPFPDTKEWQLPNEAIVSFKDENYVELHFEQPGEYEVSLYTERGLCSAFQTKKIVVLEKEFEDTDQTANPTEGVKSFINLDLYPNPVIGGNFSVDIVLSEEADVSLKLLSMANNVVLDTRGSKGKKEYEFAYNLTGLASGIYFLSLEVSNGANRVHKLVVN